jgi:GTPase
MASIFTYDPNPPRVSSPWSTPGTSTPQETPGSARHVLRQKSDRLSASPILLAEAGVSRLEPEPQEGPTEYKLHLLLRPRRKFLSSSTGGHVSGSQHSKPYLATSSSRVGSSAVSNRPVPPPSSQSRQARLQHLTTQLLWRLQQSSPFHSSSTANLILPVLPEATPRLSAPVDAAKLLPGLEESQGALYEIGVSDDGTFVGLIEEELDESLTNLQAMAASLGCVVEVLRKVIVGDCEWAETTILGEGEVNSKRHRDKLWVAEALVHPHLQSSNEITRVTSSLRLDEQGPPEGDRDTMAEVSQSKTEQMRVSLIGSSASGKSSLLGTLSTSTLDNGRGKSRLSLLRHRHEIASGITSSVAQELIGYRFPALREVCYEGLRGSEDVINYASPNVSSWNDIHGYADRLTFLSDSPGLAKFSKSTIRTLTSWQPHWTAVCVAANEAEEIVITSDSSALAVGGHHLLTAESPLDLTISHLELCSKLELAFIIVITKMDLATKTGLRQTLAKILSALKAKGRIPVMLSAVTGPVSSAPDGQTRTDHEELNFDLQQIRATDEQDVQRAIAAVRKDPDVAVPIVLTSAVTGAGIGKVHALLRSLPLAFANERYTSLAPQSHAHLAEIAPQLKVFHIDEVFAMPPSKVYSPSRLEHANKGIVLCGRMASGTISVGERLALGPFETISGDRTSQERPSSRTGSPAPQKLAVSAPTARTSSETFLRLATNGEVVKQHSDLEGGFVSVRIVSIRNLRLPVCSLLPSQVGTIGIESLSTSSEVGSLRGVRRGMVLLNPSPMHTVCHSVTASFLSSDFAFPTSPPLLLGGHAMVYINSVRAAAKVTAVALSEDDASESPSPTEMFSFDSDNDRSTENGYGMTGVNGTQDHEIKITFRFMSTVEWMQAGDKILVVPNLSAAGPITGPSGPTSGLSGFVGRVTGVNGV